MFLFFQDKSYSIYLSKYFKKPVTVFICLDFQPFKLSKNFFLSFIKIYFSYFLNFSNSSNKPKIFIKSSCQSFNKNLNSDSPILVLIISSIYFKKIYLEISKFTFF